MKTVILLIVVLAIAAGIYYWLPTLQKKDMVPEPSMATATTTDTDTSDATLDADLNSIDAELSTFTADNADIDASLNGSALPK